MYVDYNMGDLILMACAFSSLMSSVGGGIYFFLQERENSRKEELISEKQAAPYVTAYFECDYKGDHAKFGDDPDFEKADVSMDIPFKSIIVPKGFKVITYSKVNKGGVKLTLGGPSDQKCTSVHSLEVTKETGNENTTDTGNEITTDTGDCDPSRPGGCEVDIF